MILLRFSELLDFLEKEYKLPPISQKEFAEIAKLSPDRVSRIKLKKKGVQIGKKAAKKSLLPKRRKRSNGDKPPLENVTTDFLNQILEGACTLILNSKKKVHDVEKEDIFRKLVAILVDYIPDDNSLVYGKALPSKDVTSKFINGYRESTYDPEKYRSAYEFRSAARIRLLTEYNRKISYR